MCVDDYRLGRFVRGVARTFTIAQFATQTIEANPLRVGLGIYNQEATQTVEVMIDVDGTFVAFLQLTFPNEYVEWFCYKHGDLPTKRWQIRGDTVGGSTPKIIEWFLPEEVLRARLSELAGIY